MKMTHIRHSMMKSMTPTDIKVICRDRRNFYDGRPIYWYQFDCPGVVNVDKIDEFNALIPTKFLRVPYTIYYEYGGTHEEAIDELTKEGFTDIVEGDEL
jgi:hypothetical protein